MPERHKGAKSNIVFIATSSIEQYGYDHSRAPWPGTPSRPYGHLDILDVVTVVPPSRPLATGRIAIAREYADPLQRVRRRHSAATARCPDPASPQTTSFRTRSSLPCLVPSSYMFDTAQAKRCWCFRGPNRGKSPHFRLPDPSACTNESKRQRGGDQ